MADKSNTTNATELLNKICSGGTITPQDLGTPTANTQATTYLTEGTTPLRKGQTTRLSLNPFLVHT